MNTLHEREQLRHQVAQELIAGRMIAEWRGRHGVHGALVVPDGRVVVCTAYHSYADFAAHQDWPPDVLHDVGVALHQAT
ncbi:MAG TPA: hypothetical protein VF060_10850 [Trebonia sp.]